MTRHVGEFAVVDALPAWVALLAVFVTQLGDVWFVMLLVGTLYWFGDALPGPLSFDRTRGAFAVALAVGALTVTTALKGWLAFERPPGADDPTALEFLPALLQGLYSTGATATGFAFPSGHAVAAIVVYGGLALLTRSRRAAALAVAVVVAVSATRVVLRVHYLVDVLAGLAIGAVFLLAVYVGAARGANPSRAFSVALGFGVLGVLLGGYTHETMAALGGTLGTRIAWGALGDAVVPGAETRVEGVAAAAVGLSFLAFSGIVSLAHPEPYVFFLATGVVLAGVVAAPVVGEAAARRVGTGRERGV